MTEEDHIRFGLGFTNDKRPIDECVLDYVSQLETLLQKERQHNKAINEELRKKLSIAETSHFDSIYNQHEIEKTWGIIGNFNRHCLELHGAVREKMRDLTWELYEDRKNSIVKNDELKEKLATLLAEQYSLGWKAHAEHIGEPPPFISPKQWAKCNFESFRGEANHFIENNYEI